MVVGLLGGFKEEDNFLDLGVFLVGLKKKRYQILVKVESGTSEAIGSAVATKKFKRRCAWLQRWKKEGGHSDDACGHLGYRKAKRSGYV